MTSVGVGTQLDHYRIDELVARSGMASLFRAIDLNSGRQVAIKLPHPEMECDPGLFSRFQREIDIGQKLDHPGVMKVYREEKRSRVYMAAEWAEGRLLRKVLGPEHKLPVDRTVALTIKILDALDYIHSKGVIHRDLKPENVMVDEKRDDAIKLIDFGIAGDESAKRLTFGKLSNVMGTPDYIAPEQVKGKRGDGRTDIYAMGVMLYEMLTGKLPWLGPNQLAIINSRLLNNPIPPREIDPSITPQMQEIIYRAMEREPAKRYATAREFINDLEHQDQVGVVDRPEFHDYKVQKTGIVKKILMYAGLILIPIVIFSFLLWIARKA